MVHQTSATPCVWDGENTVHLKPWKLVIPKAHW